MEDQFKIFIDRLRGGNVEQLERRLSPEFIEFDEPDVKFSSPVNLGGEAYLTEDSLILRINIETKGSFPCTICNRPVDQEISIKGLYHVIPVDEIKGGVYEIKELLRENIILEAPSFVECNQGSCSRRKEVEKYMSSNSNENEATDEVYYPFKDL